MASSIRIGSRAFPREHVLDCYCKRTPKLARKILQFLRAIRVVATANRWRTYKRGIASNGMSNLLSGGELNRARDQILRLHQLQQYSNGIQSLSKNALIPCRSKLAQFKPFHDGEGILRSESRLEHCSFLSYNEKFPIILERKSCLGQAVVWDYHRMYPHGGPRLVLTAISRKHIMDGGLILVKSVTSKCTTCLRYSGRCLAQQMAPLPFERLVLTFFLAATGVDYAGYIKVTPHRGRGITSTKEFICIFICFATRAMRIEIASDLTSKAFLAAFDRFSNRRNLPGSMHSDNGTNF